MIPVGMIFIKLCHYLECFGWRLDFHRTLRIVKLEILELYIFFPPPCPNKFNVYTLDGVEGKGEKGNCGRTKKTIDVQREYTTRNKRKSANMMEILGRTSLS